MEERGHWRCRSGTPCKSCGWQYALQGGLEVWGHRSPCNTHSVEHLAGVATGSSLRQALGARREAEQLRMRAGIYIYHIRIRVCVSFKSNETKFVPDCSLRTLNMNETGQEVAHPVDSMTGVCMTQCLTDNIVPSHSANGQGRQTR
jgi:hypothetical protein